MHFHILTLFPDMINDGLNTSILGRAMQKGLIHFEAVNIRDYTQDKHNRVDDYPYGGGAGMLMQVQPVYDAYQAVCEKIGQRRNVADSTKNTADCSNEKDSCTKKKPRVVYLTPQGRVFDQTMAKEFAKEEDLIFLCGHYEGIDERVLEEIVTDCVSIGDYVLTGGELPAMVMIDAISRMVPGVLKNEISGETESFHENLLEYPQYTRPENWMNKPVPQVLLSGDHAKIEKWRLEQSIARTKERRPDLYEKYNIPGRTIEFLSQDKLHHMQMIEAVRNNEAEVVLLRKDGVLIRMKDTDEYMVTAQSLDAGERLLSAIEGKIEAITCFQLYLAESVQRRFGLQTDSICHQAVYTKKTVPQGEGETVEQIQKALEDHRVFVTVFLAEEEEKAAKYKEMGMKLSRKKIYYLSQE